MTNTPETFTWKTHLMCLPDYFHRFVVLLQEFPDCLIQFVRFLALQERFVCRPPAKYA